MSDSPSNADGTNAINPIVRRAHRLCKKQAKKETIARARWLMDLKFVNGDAYNMYQWPDDIMAARGDDPSLTINETQQHNLHIRNEAKQNKASVKYRPVGDGASLESAGVMEGLYRHIQNISNAQMAQGMAIDFQVDAGLGFTVIRSKYIDPSPTPGPDAWNQDIYIDGIANPLNVMLVDAQEIDGSDASAGFIFNDRPREQVEEEYPEFKGRAVPANAVDGEDAWIGKDYIREAEFYEIVEKRDELIGDEDGNVEFRSKLTAELVKLWEAQERGKQRELKRRPIIRKSVKCHNIIGDKVISTTDVPGTGIPIISWCGTVTTIDGELDRKGHTRTMISPQQMLNYNWSASVKFGALQSQTPYMVSVEAIENNETFWWTANTKNPAVLPYKAYDDAGNPLPKPERQQPPASAPAFLDGIQQAHQFMLSASGQYEAEMGSPGNERSGKAINERQRQGDRATYHFIDNQALAIRRQGQIVMEWIPVIYDTPRVLRIIGEDGTETHVQLDPAAEQAHQEVVEGAMAIFNPNIGRYEVVSDVGPDYATQRQEAFNAIVQILTQAPELINKIGDLLFKVADFPLADQIAERLKPGFPPEAQQAITQLQEQLRASNMRLGEAMQALTEERLQTKAKDSRDVVDEFKADTERVKMLLDAAVKADPVAALAMIRTMMPQTVMQAMEDNLGPVRLASAANLTDQTNGMALPGATGGLPIRVPNVGQEAATPGGQS